MTEDIKIIELKKLSLSDSDILVFKAKYRLSAESLAKLKNEIDGIIPPQAKVLILGADIDFSVLSTDSIMQAISEN